MTLPFADLQAWQIALVLATFFGGFLIRGAFGFGSNMPIILVTTWILGPHHAIVLTALSSIASQLWLIPGGVRTADWSVTRSLILGLVTSTIIGTVIFASTRSDGLSVIMGIIIVFLIVSEKFALMETVDRHISVRGPLMSFLLSFCSGIFGSLSGGGGVYFLVTFLRHVCPTPAVLRGTTITVAATMTILRVGEVTVAGFMSTQILAEAIALIPITLLGTWVGTTFFRKATPKAFYTGLQLVLIGLAFALAGKGIYALLAAS